MKAQRGYYEQTAYGESCRKGNRKRGDLLLFIFIKEERCLQYRRSTFSGHSLNCLFFLYFSLSCFVFTLSPHKVTVSAVFINVNPPRGTDQKYT